MSTQRTSALVCDLTRPASFKRFMALSAAIIVSVLVASCDPFHTGFAPIEEAKTYQAQNLQKVTSPQTLKVMNYNLKFGGARLDFFFDCHGDRVLMQKSEVLSHLDALVELINELDPDLLFIQEIDVLSKRSAYIDQVQYILDHSQLNYGAYASQWRADYVPSDGIGPVDSGNAILAKTEIINAQRLALPLRTDQGGLTKYFYLRRNLLVANLNLTSPIRLVGTHLSAYSKDNTKFKQLALFEEELSKYSGLVIGAGDLNTLPPGSKELKNFPDSVCEDEFTADDFSEETDYLQGLYDTYHSAISLSDYQKDNIEDTGLYFTHTTDKNGSWNRKLDYIFTNIPLVEGSGKTYQDTTEGGIALMPLSDHAPLTVEIQL